jgi:3-mercaptopyruvate sulfurtransferase SseA
MKKFLISIIVMFLILGGCADEVVTPQADALEVPRITAEELKAKLDRGVDVIIVDARGKESFEQEHIKGAFSMPLGEVEARHQELPKDKEIVFY